MSTEKRKVTQEDLDLNPELVEQGVQVGDEYPVTEDNADESATGDGYVGGHPPGGPK